MSLSEKHTIVALVHDRPGVLSRVCNVVRRREFNIASLAVGHSETSGLSRMTIVVEGDYEIAEQVTKQLRKLIDVVSVVDISEESVVARELALVKVKATPYNRSEIIQIVDIFRANIIDLAPDSLIIEVAGGEDKIGSLLQLLHPFGVHEVMRSGRLSIARGLLAAARSSGTVRGRKKQSAQAPAVERDRTGG